LTVIQHCPLAEFSMETPILAEFQRSFNGSSGGCSGVSADGGECSGVSADGSEFSGVSADGGEFSGVSADGGEFRRMDW
jgi:hypothetical protein